MDRGEIDFDFSSAEYGDHWQEIYARMRTGCPVARSTAHDGFWVVSTRELARRVAKDTETFSSDHDPHGERDGYLGVGIPASVGTRSLPQEADPPESLFFRRAMNAAFTPAAAATWRPWLEEVTGRLLDRRLPYGRVDIAEDLGFPLPAVFIVALLGLPVADWHALVEPFHTIVTTPSGEPEHAAAGIRLAEVLKIIGAAVPRRRHRPGDDLLSSLIRVRQDGRALTDQEIVSIAQLLLFGGVDSTTALLSSAIDWLDTHPEQRAELVARPPLRRSAAEEFLRYFSPIHLNGRTVRRDTELGGRRLREGDRLLISWAAANHDDAAVDHPEEVRLDRDDNRHLAFGHGTHYCLGAHYARTMFDVLLTAVLDEIPDFRVDRPSVQRYPSVGQVNGFSRLPVEFAPRAATRPAEPFPDPPRV